MLYFTSSDFVGYHPNFPIVSSHTTGGMSSKTASVENALGCEVVTDLTKLNSIDKQQDLIVEPLAIKAPRNVPEELQYGSNWKKLREIEQSRIDTLKEYPGRKILLCSEMEILRWNGQMRQEILEAVNRKVFASCRYQKKLMESMNIQSRIIYEPIDEYLYYPSIKNQKQVIAIGSVKHIKNIKSIIEAFRILKDTNFETVYIGCPAMWAGVVANNDERIYDTELYHELIEVSDIHYKSSPATKIAKILSESTFYINFAYHEVCCRTAMEALMSGCAVIGGKHPLWKEYPTFDQIENISELPKVLKKFTNLSLEKTNQWEDNVHKWAFNNFSYKVFSQKINEAFNAY